MNEAIRTARRGSKLYGLETIVDHVTKSSKFFWRHCDGICNSPVLDLLLRDWTNSMIYQWSCLNCSKKICQTELAGRKAGISRKHIVFFFRCATFFYSDGLKNFAHQGPEHGHIANCKLLASCTNNKEVYLTVLRAHSREGHLQYLRSLEADLADTVQDEGDSAEESVSASSFDREGEVGACEVGIQYPTLQSIYAGKLNKQSIQVHIICDIIDIYMISQMIS